MKYWFITTGDSHAPQLLCIMVADKLMKTQTPQNYFVTWRVNTALKDKPLEVFERKIYEHEAQKQLLKIPISTNVSALKASFFVANRIA